MKKGDELYSGKVKSVFTTEDPDCYILHFRDDATAFNARKKDTLEGKGKINNLINSHIMCWLEERGIKTHFLEHLTDKECAVKALNMLPVECVVRNYTAGGLSKRLGLEEGLELKAPILEFFYKSDELDDPMINEDHIRVFDWATDAEIAEMKRLSLQINDLLKPLFLQAGILLVDYKLEFGRFNGELLLGDEFTPDGCRLWDTETLNKLDKDRFRRDMGGVLEAYHEVARRLGIALN